MCGIHLIWGKGANEAAITQLIKTSTHRGPDQNAAFSPWPGLWIGVNRLKIVHPGPDADQPFWSPDGCYFLVWNGEVYNYKVLKKQLEKLGITFLTNSDTEVLLHYLRLFGSKGLENIEGMYSLIFGNTIEKSVLISRDKNGEKPLFYTHTPDQLILSSDSRGIRSLKATSLDQEQFDHYFYLRASLPGKTFLKGIREWKPNRSSTIYQYSTFRWDTIPSTPSTKALPNAQEFRSRLESAIQSQFHSDAPTGIQLSGGADSSLLYALWYEQSGTKLPAYTIQVESSLRKKYSDADAAKLFVKKYPADHSLIEIDQSRFLANWDEYIQSIDLPIGDSAGFLTWMIGKEASKSVKVMISGAGADELWGGYQRHAAYDFYLKQKGLLLKLSGLAKKLPLTRKWDKFFSSIHPDSRKTFLNFSALMPLPTDLFGDYERLFLNNTLSYKEALEFDRHNYLVQDVLRIQDNALMAHGIEGRAPYLDQGMIDLWNQVSDEKELKSKTWIKSSLRELGLNWVAGRKKFGFGLPLEEWLQGDGPVAKQVFSSIKDFEQSHGKNFAPAMADLCKNPEKAAKQHFLILYNLFLLAEWVKFNKL